MTLAELGAVLNFAIVMAFVYLVLSVAAAMAVEAVVGRLRLRARLLHERVQLVLGQAQFGADLLTQPLIRSLTAGRSGLNNIPPDVFAQAVLARVVEGGLVNSAVLPQVLQDLARAENLGEAQIAEWKAVIAKWYGAFEERFQGEYLKRSSVWLGLAGFALAVLLNVDSIEMTRAIWTNRFALDATVERVAEVQGRLAAEVARSGQSADVVLDRDPGLKHAVIGLAQTDPALAGLRLPVGWPMRDLACEAAGRPDCPGAAQVLMAEFSVWPGWGPVIQKLIGWAITALAVVPGAKFWLDILGQAIAVRASARPKPAAEG